jgi:hypothetical protein
VVNCGGKGNKSSAVLRGTHCHLHVGPVPHVSESSPSAVLRRRLIRREDTLQEMIEEGTRVRLEAHTSALSTLVGLERNKLKRTAQPLHTSSSRWDPRLTPEDAPPTHPPAQTERNERTGPASQQTRSPVARSRRSGHSRTPPSVSPRSPLALGDPPLRRARLSPAHTHARDGGGPGSPGGGHGGGAGGAALRRADVRARDARRGGAPGEPRAAALHLAEAQRRGRRVQVRTAPVAAAPLPF